VDEIARNPPRRSRPAKGKPASRQRRRHPYHHGDLRAALLEAGEKELAENGVEGFTLRGAARRAGVSHAAPAHHFKDVSELLTELAAVGFERFTEFMLRFGESAPKGTVDYIVAIARGYATFAARNPHFLRLIFRVAAIRNNPRYNAAGEAAFRIPVEAVGAYYGSADPMADPELTATVIGLWSTVHGFSDLMLAGQLHKGGPHVTEETLINNLLPAIIRQFFAGRPPRPKPMKRGAGSAPVRPSRLGLRPRTSG